MRAAGVSSSSPASPLILLQQRNRRGSALTAPLHPHSSSPFFWDGWYNALVWPGRRRFGHDHHDRLGLSVLYHHQSIGLAEKRLFPLNYTPKRSQSLKTTDFAPAPGFSAQLVRFLINSHSKPKKKLKGSRIIIGPNGLVNALKLCVSRVLFWALFTHGGRRTGRPPCTARTCGCSRGSAACVW